MESVDSLYDPLNGDFPETSLLIEDDVPDPDQTPVDLGAEA